jgi:hypothetical protein
MAHPKYGKKFTCYDCGSKFYDMGAQKPLCPKCGANQRKAPKKASGRAAKSMMVDFGGENEEEFEPTENPIDNGLDEFPIKESSEETFEADGDHLPIDGVSEDDY